MYKKLLLIFGILILFSFTHFASAQFQGDPFVTPQGQVIDTQLLLISALWYMWYVVVTVVIIFFIMAGFKFLTAKGDPYELQTARRFLIWAVAGAIVIILAFPIISILRNTLNI